MDCWAKNGRASISRFIENVFEMRELDKRLFYEDFIDFIDCLIAEEVRALIVGGYAVVLPGYHRVTGDLLPS